MSGRGRGRGGRRGGGRGFPSRGGGGGGGSTLSDRFTRLNVKHVNLGGGGGREIRRISTQQTQKGKREAQQMAFRRGGNVAAAARGVKFQQRGGGGGGRGGGGRGRGIKVVRGGRGRGRGRGRGGGDKKSVSKDDLDAQMDEYHFKAGKGPDPKVLKAERTKTSLDDDLDSYWAAKDKAAAETPAVATTTEAT